jgi:hypothetical protein
VVSFYHSLKLLLPSFLLRLYQSFKKFQKRSFILLPNLPNAQKASPRYIVTLTTYGKRLHTTTPYTIASLLRQQELPDKIILWVAYGTEIPLVYEKLTRKGLEIRFCEDLKSYKKLIPALAQFPEDVLITADDDVYYPKNWFLKFKEAHEQYPDRICAVRAHRFALSEDKCIEPYSEWKKEINAVCDTRYIFPTGVSGILYPPACLDARCMQAELFLRLAPQGDDIWFWAMAKLKGTSHVLVKFDSLNFDQVDDTDGGLWENHNSSGGNDIQIAAVFAEFPQLYEVIK